MKSFCHSLIDGDAICAGTVAALPLSRPWGEVLPGAIMGVSGELTLREPAGPRGECKHGFRVLNDCAAEWQNYYGVQFEVQLPDARAGELTATILRATNGTNAHTFENLLQLKDFPGLDAPGKQFLRHTAQWNSDPVGSAQFVTDCDGYSAPAPAVARFAERWDPGVDNEDSRSTGNADGVLKLDVHSLWPPRQAIIIATASEQHDTEKRLFYTVRGDGKTLADGKFDAWILGSPALGANQLRVELADGRGQEISIENFNGSGRDIQISGTESRDGKILRRESTADAGVKTK